VLYLGRLTAQVKAKDVTHNEVVQLITGGTLVKEGDAVKVTDPSVASADAGVDEPPSETGAQS